MKPMKFLAAVLLAAAFAGSAAVAADDPAAQKPAGVEKPAAPAGAQTVAPRSEMRDKLPADCLLFVEIPSYRQLCEGIAYQAGRFKPTTWQEVSQQFMGAMGFPGLPFPRDFADLADLNGPIGVALFAPGKEGSKPPVVLFRIRDKQQFLNKTVIAMNGEGPDKDGLYHYAAETAYHFALLRETVVLSSDIGPVKKVLDNYRSANPTRLAQSGIGGTLVVSSNLAEVNRLYGDLIRKEMEEAKQKILSEMPGKAADAKEAGTAMAGMFDLYAKLVTDLLKASDRGTLTVTLDKKGLTFGFEHLAIEGTELAGSLAKVGKPDLKGMQWVPADAIAAGGCDVSGLAPDFNGWLNDLVAVLMKGYGSDKSLEDYIKKQQEAISMMTGRSAFAWVPGAKEAGHFGTFITVSSVKDPQKHLELSDALLADAGRIIESMNKKLIEQGQPGFDFKFEPRQKAFEHGGVTVWRYPVHFGFIAPKEGAEPEMVKMMSDMMKNIYGEAVYAAAVADMTVWTLGGEPERLMKAVLDNMKGDGSGLPKSPIHTQAFRTDPSGACVVGYVKPVDMIGSILSGVVHAASSVEKPHDDMKMVKIISELCTGSKSAVGFQARVNGRTVTSELHVPDEQIAEFCSIGMAATMRMAMQHNAHQREEAGRPEAPQPKEQPQEQSK